MYMLLVVVKLWTEVALLALVGQWLLAVLVGARREGNLVYGLLRVVSSPAVRLVAWLGPRRLQARQHSVIAAVLLGVLWLASTAGKLWFCMNAGVAACH